MQQNDFERSMKARDYTLKNSQQLHPATAFFVA